MLECGPDNDQCSITSNPQYIQSTTESVAPLMLIKRVGCSGTRNAKTETRAPSKMHPATPKNFSDVLVFVKPFYLHM